MSRLPVVLLLAPLVFPALAAAQPAPASAAGPGPAPARVTEMNFTDGDQVDGARQAPEASLTQGRAAHLRPSLIVVRESFRPELLSSVEQL
jgi:hypothetical protein